MSFDVYRSGFLSKEHEKKQLWQLLGYLEREFAPRREKCTLIIEPTISYTLYDRKLARKPDALVIKDNLLILLELKAWGDGIDADCSDNGVWKDRYGNPLHNADYNPWRQAGGHRYGLIAFIEENFPIARNAPAWARKDDYSMRDWIKGHIHSWVITSESSRPVVRGGELAKWPSFKVLPVEEVPNALAFLRSDDLLLTEHSMRILLDTLHAVRTTTKEWFRGTLTDPAREFVGLIPKISQMITSDSYADKEKSLNYIQELELKQHVKDVLDCWHDRVYSSIRQHALVILIDWQYDKIGAVLDEALQDSNEDVMHMALQYLSQNGHIEPFETLRRMLNEDYSPILPQVLRALSRTNHGEAPATILLFASKTFSDRPFAPYQYWFEKAGLSTSGTKEEREKFSYDEGQRHLLIKTFEALIDAFVDLHCEESISWLKSIIRSPTSMGFESDDYFVLQNNVSDFYKIFRVCCRALGRIGSDDPEVVPLLISRLENSPDDYWWDIIRAIGEIGEISTGPCLMKYLASEDESITQATALALTRMRFEPAFEKILELYEDRFKKSPYGLFDYEPFFRDCLTQLDGHRYGLAMSKLLTSETLSKDQKRDCLMRLGEFVTDDSMDLLRSLLSDKEIAEEAALTLSSLSSSGRREISNSLLKSQDPWERYLGFVTMDKDLYGSPNELSKFESDSNERIRQGVAWMYVSLKKFKDLLHFADDPDPEVRSVVIHGIMSQSLIQNAKWVRKSRLVDGDDVRLFLTEESLFACNSDNNIESIPVADISRFSGFSTPTASGLIISHGMENSVVNDLFRLVGHGTSQFYTSDATIDTIIRKLESITKLNRDPLLTKQFESNLWDSESMSRR